MRVVIGENAGGNGGVKSLQLFGYASMHSVFWVSTLPLTVATLHFLVMQTWVQDTKG